MHLDNFTLRSLSARAHKQFSETQDRLDNISATIETRMEGETVLGLIGAIIGTLLWGAFAYILFYNIREQINTILLIIGVAIVYALLIIMLVDEIVRLFYYRKIAAFGRAISLLKDRVDVGKGAIQANYDIFAKAQASGWDYPLDAANSILDEATDVDTKLSNMETIRTGFICGAKNFFYYASVIVVSIIGFVLLFDFGNETILGISRQNIPENTLTILNLVAVAIVGIGELILAKFIWGQTYCSVTNWTLLAIIAAPIGYLAFVSAVTGIVMLAIWILSGLLAVIGAILGIALVGGILFGSISGG